MKEKSSRLKAENVLSDSKEQIDEEIQEMVAGVRRRKSKGLHGKFATSKTFDKPHSQSVGWQRDSAISFTFCEWRKGLLQKLCFWNLFRIYLLALKAMKPRFSFPYFSECGFLVETEFIYRVIYRAWINVMISSILAR